jgi:hypothetical protein
MVPPTFGTLAKKFHVTNQQASYFTTCYILFTGVIPLLITPYVNIYGRRPAYLVRDSSPSFELSFAYMNKLALHYHRYCKQHRIC